MEIVFEEVMVQVPMPAWCVPHVTQFLTELSRSRSQATVDERAAPASPSPSGSTWTTEDLRRLRPLIRYNKVAMAMLDLASENPGRFVTFPAACARAGLETSQGRSGVGALTKVCKKIAKEHWPVTYAWAGNGEPVACYIMADDVARMWRKVSAE